MSTNITLTNYAHANHCTHWALFSIISLRAFSLSLLFVLFHLCVTFLVAPVFQYFLTPHDFEQLPSALVPFLFPFLVIFFQDTPLLLLSFFQFCLNMQSEPAALWANSPIESKRYLIVPWKVCFSIHFFPLPPLGYKKTAHYPSVTSSRCSEPSLNHFHLNDWVKPYASVWRLCHRAFASHWVGKTRRPIFPRGHEHDLLFWDEARREATEVFFCRVNKLSIWAWTANAEWQKLKMEAGSSSAWQMNLIIMLNKERALLLGSAGKLWGHQHLLFSWVLQSAVCQQEGADETIALHKPPVFKIRQVVSVQHLCDVGKEKRKRAGALLGLILRSEG